MNYLLFEKNYFKDEITLRSNKNIETILISEILIHGYEEKQVIKEVMKIKPGSTITVDNIKEDLDEIYSTGLFSNTQIRIGESTLGLQLIVEVEPNQILTKIIVFTYSKKKIIIPSDKINEFFKEEFGKILNLNVI